LYNNIDGNINGIFSELNTINNIVWEGGKNSVAVSDINNDSLMDIIIGGTNLEDLHFSREIQLQLLRLKKSESILIFIRIHHHTQYM